MSSRTESILVVEKTMPHERLDTFLRTQFPTLSRGAIQRLIQHGDVRVAGKPVKASHSPRAGEKIEIHWPSGLKQEIAVPSVDRIFAVAEGKGIVP